MRRIVLVLINAILGRRCFHRCFLSMVAIGLSFAVLSVSGYLFDFGVVGLMECEFAQGFGVVVCSAVIL